MLIKLKLKFNICVIFREGGSLVRNNLKKKIQFSLFLSAYSSEYKIPEICLNSFTIVSIA